MGTKYLFNWSNAMQRKKKKEDISINNHLVKKTQRRES